VHQIEASAARFDALFEIFSDFFAQQPFPLPLVVRLLFVQTRP
jgi:hypothetical protein